MLGYDDLAWMLQGVLDSCLTYYKTRANLNDKTWGQPVIEQCQLDVEALCEAASVSAKAESDQCTHTTDDETQG
jgi:hypothetical protein